MKFNINEYFKIKRRIEESDTFYAALYNLADLSFDKTISTACVSYDKEGNFLDMKINPDFWEELNEEAKCFVIMHELYHTIYDHAKRMKLLDLEPELSNIASDIVINHHLCEKIGIVRELFDWQRFCWVETCFENESNIPTDKSFEYYYNKLKVNKNKNQPELLGTHSSGEEKTKDNDNTSPQPEVLNESNVEDDNFSENFKDILENNPNIVNDFKNSPMSQIIPESLEKYEKNSKFDSKEIDKFLEIPKSNEKPNFANLMKILTPKKKLPTIEMKETWIGTHRRYTSFLKQNSNIILPNRKEIIHPKKSKKKEIWLFMDTSGSCTGLFPFFSLIVNNLLQNKEINCRAFSFDDYCYEIKKTDKTIRASFGNNRGGFDCIEQKILELMKKGEAYPDNVVVMSDGGVHFKLKNSLLKPENWILLLNVKKESLTPPGGKFFLIDSNFFKIDNKKFKP